MKYAKPSAVITTNISMIDSYCTKVQQNSFDSSYTLTLMSL